MGSASAGTPRRNDGTRSVGRARHLRDHRRSREQENFPGALFSKVKKTNIYVLSMIFFRKKPRKAKKILRVLKKPAQNSLGIVREEGSEQKFEMPKNSKFILFTSSNKDIYYTVDNLNRVLLQDGREITGLYDFGENKVHKDILAGYWLLNVGLEQRLKERDSETKINFAKTVGLNPYDEKYSKDPRLLEQDINNRVRNLAVSGMKLQMESELYIKAMEAKEEELEAKEEEIKQLERQLSGKSLKDLPEAEAGKMAEDSNLKDADKAEPQAVPEAVPAKTSEPALEATPIIPQQPAQQPESIEDKLKSVKGIDVFGEEVKKVGNDFYVIQEDGKAEMLTPNTPNYIAAKAIYDAQPAPVAAAAAQVVAALKGYETPAGKEIPEPAPAEIKDLSLEGKMEAPTEMPTKEEPIEFEMIEPAIKAHKVKKVLALPKKEGFEFVNYDGMYAHVKLNGTEIKYRLGTIGLLFSDKHQPIFVNEVGGKETYGLLKEVYTDARAIYVKKHSALTGGE